MKTPVALLSLALAVSGCTPSPHESESHYPTDQTMVRQSVERCRVIDLRWVRINAQPIRSDQSSYDQAAEKFGGPSTKSGSAIGGALGGAIADRISSSGDTTALVLGAFIGATTGAHIGSKVDADSARNRGIEYSVIESNGRESIITQPYNKEDRISQVGTSCRIVTNAGKIRVLPAEHLPDSVASPKLTTLK